MRTQFRTFIDPIEAAYDLDFEGYTITYNGKLLTFDQITLLHLINPEIRYIDTNPETNFIITGTYNIYPITPKVLEDAATGYAQDVVTDYIESSDDSKEISEYTLREIAATAYNEWLNECTPEYYTE